MICIKTGNSGFSAIYSDKAAKAINGINIAWKKTAYLLSFSNASILLREKATPMNNIFKKLLLTIAFIFCISMTALAQDKDKKPPPKKIDPPVVRVKDGKKPPPKEDKPRSDDNSGKKPQAFFLNTENIIGISFV